MIKRAIAVALMLMLALTLEGCQLAMEETSKGQDLLIGVSLRVEDWGKPTGWDEEGEPYWEHDSEEEAIELTPQQAAALMRGEFPEILYSNERPIGPYAFYLAQEEEDGEPHISSVNTWPGSAQKHIAVSDEGEAYTIDLKVYVCGEDVSCYDVNSSHVFMYIDDIYRRPDGSIYCVQDRGGVMGHIDGFQQTIRQELTTTDIHGIASGYAIEITTEYVLVPEMREASVLAFDAEHNLLAAMPVMPRADGYGGWDCEIDPPANTAYMLLEQTASNEEGKVALTRSFAEMPRTEAERSLASFTIYVPSEDHLAKPCYVWLAKSE